MRDHLFSVTPGSDACGVCGVDRLEHGAPFADPKPEPLTDQELDALVESIEVHEDPNGDRRDILRLVAEVRRLRAPNYTAPGLDARRIYVDGEPFVPVAEGECRCVCSGCEQSCSSRNR